MLYEMTMGLRVRRCLGGWSWGCWGETVGFRKKLFVEVEFLIHDVLFVEPHLKYYYNTGILEVIDYAMIYNDIRYLTTT